MADLTTTQQGIGSLGNTLFRNEQDGSYSEAVTANLRGWDSTNLVYVKLLVDALGNLRVSPGAATASTGLSFAAITTAASGDTTIVASVASKKIKVVSYSLVVNAAVVVQWKSGASTARSGAMSLAANGGVVVAGAPGAHVLETAVGQGLVLNLGGAIQTSGHIAYFSEA